MFFEVLFLGFTAFMFIAQAHSFSQQAWLAITLAWIAGYTNILTILTCGTVTSHISGTTSNLGREVAEGSWELAAFSFTLLVTFYIGAMISGFCTEHGRRRGWESIYVLPMALEAVLLLIFCVALEINGGSFQEWYAGIFIMTGVAAMAMGLQNATITRISSGVIRTTHVTGVVTDLGLETAYLYYWLRDRQKRHRLVFSSARVVKNFKTHSGANRLALLLAIFCCFVLGSLMGTFAYVYVDRWSMVPPVLFLGWIVFQDVIRPIAEIEEAKEAPVRPDGSALPTSLAIYHVRKAKNRGGKLHRMPNLVGWAQRLPTRIRVVILDLGHDARLDANAAMDLRAVISLLESKGRKMILVGLNEQECEQLRHASLEKLRRKDFFLDLDSAIVHALAEVEKTEAIRISRAD